MIKKGKANSADELRISKITTICLGILALTLGIVFEKQNIAFMVSLAFAIAGSALFPYTSPALFSMTIGFVGIRLLSILDKSARAKQDRAGFLAQQVRSETGIGAEGASGH